MKSIRRILISIAIAMSLATKFCSPVQAQVYPIVNFRWHDGYVWYDPAYYPALHAGGIGVFPELDHVNSITAGSLWFIQSIGSVTCNGNCSDPRFTGCQPGGMNELSWPPPQVGGPVQSCGGCPGVYLRLDSSRAIEFAGTTEPYCGHAGGIVGQHVEVCDAASGISDTGYAYFVQSPFGQLRSLIGYPGGGKTPADFYVEQWGSQANYIPTLPAFWISGTGTAVKSSLYLQAYTDNTARWNGDWQVAYYNLGCTLDFPLHVVAAGQP